MEDLNIFEKIFFGVIIAIEIYYWLIWFPKAWKTNATQEIIDFKAYLKERG